MSKKTVHYDKKMGVQMVQYLDGQSALLYPIDHPDTRVSNTTSAITSKVVSYDEATGVLETQNTIYVPGE